MTSATGPALIVRSREGEWNTVPLSEKPITLGRAVNCDVILRDDGGVSREHAQVWLDGAGRVLVRDCGSKNGTRVDSGDAFRNATRSALRCIRIGEYEMELAGLEPLPATPNQQQQDNVRFAPDEPARIGDTRFFPSSRRLDLNLQRLTLLMSLTERIGGAFERKQLLEQAIDACCEALGFERGLIALKTTRGDPELPVTRNIERDETGAFKVSRTLINRALVQGQRAVVNNPATDLVDNLSESLVRFPICSALCVPILHRDEILGVIYGDRITQASTYTSEDVDFLAAIAQQVGVGLANLRLFQEHLRAQKVYHELEQARSIQQRLLPSQPLQCGRIVLAGYNAPSSEVGGDYFDYFELPAGGIGMIIADVTGHGLPAALMMANFQAASRVALTDDIPLPDVARRLNRLVCGNTNSNVFITAIVGRLDPTSGAIEYVSAGHPGPVLLSSGDAVAREPDSSLPLGISADESFRVEEIRPGDALSGALFFTDGLIEAESPDERLMGLAPLLTTLSTSTDYAPATVIQTARDTVRTHTAGHKLSDDLTLLAINFNASANDAAAQT